jgi:hypothetical protein
MRRDPDHEVQGLENEAIEALIETHFDLCSRLADSDLPVTRDASNALEWCKNNRSGDDPIEQL